MLISGVFGPAGMRAPDAMAARSQFFIGNLLLDLLDVYSWLIIGRVVVSWIGLSPTNQVVQFLKTVTDPLLVPIQKIIPPLGGVLDISPIIGLLFVQLLKWVVSSIFS